MKIKVVNMYKGLRTMSGTLLAIIIIICKMNKITKTKRVAIQ